MRFMDIFTKEWARIFHHKDLRSLLIGGPILYGLLLPSVYWDQRLTNRPVAVLDQDQTYLSRELIRQLNASDGIAIVDAVSDVEEGKDALMNHEVDALLTIPADFSSNFKRKKSAVASIAVSSSNLAIAGPILQSSADVAGTLSARVFTGTIMARNIHRDRAETLAQPLTVDTRPIYNPAQNQSDAMIPGLLFVILQQVVIVALCLIMAEEKEGNLAPSDPSRRLSLILGKSLPYAVVNFMFCVLFFCFLLPIFKIPFHLEKLPAFLLLSASFAVAVSLAGFLLGQFFKDRLTVMIALMFYSLPGFVASGYSWPEFALPWDVRIFSYFFPITHFVEQIRRVILGPIGPMAYMHSLMALGLYAAVCLAASTYLLGRKKLEVEKKGGLFP